MDNKKRSRLTLAIQIILVYLASQLLPVFVIPFLPEADRIPSGMNLSLFSAFLGSVLMVAWNGRKKWTPINSLTDHPSAPIGKTIRNGIFGFVGAVLIQIIAMNVEYLLFRLPVASENTEVLLDLTNRYPFFILNIILFAPVMEEFVFRKAIVTHLVDAIGIVGAATISALLFAVAHNDGHYLVYGALGLWFSFLYYRTRNIATPMIAHALMNAVSALPILSQLVS
jgi:membrane protease YdiL (CAAX protease family)